MSVIPGQTERPRGTARGAVLRGTPEPRRASLADVAKSAAEDLFDLLAAQIKLARVELTHDMRQMAGRAGRVLLFVPPILLGYALAMLALASWLEPRWGRPGALAAVAALNLIVGVVGARRALTLFQQSHVLDHTGAETAVTMDRAMKALSQPEEPTRG
jgi:hypothetical protein